MQRDTYLTLEDILADSDDDSDDNDEVGPYRALFETLGDLEFSKSVADPLAIPKDLRFLYVTPGSHESEEHIRCELKPSEADADNEPFIAVSYCWDSYGMASTRDNAPSVSVLDHGIERSPRCPPDVLLRAIRFARVAEIHRLWIDQECIDQSDSEDVRRHLQCMHHIYAKADIVAGMLSFEIANSRQLYDLAVIVALPEGLEPESPMRQHVLGISTDVKRVKSITRLLHSIVLDRWFTRTWCFQERHSSAGDMTLLLPESPVLEHVSKKDNVSYKAKVADFRLPLLGVVFLAATWQAILERTGSMTAELEAALTSLYRVTRRFCPLGLKFDTAFNMLQGGQLQRDEEYTARTIFHHIERCDNRLVSDRVAIFANVARFATYADMSKQNSYSIALLALLSINEQLPAFFVRVDEADKDNMEAFARIVSHKHVLEEVFYLRSIIDEENDSGTRDLHALEVYLQAVTNVELSDCHNIEEFLSAFVSDSDLPLQRSRGILEEQMEDVLSVCVLPLAVTIRGILENVIARQHKRAWKLSTVHGNMLVAHAIACGQLPRGSKFLAFCGRVSWRPAFVEEHFA